MSAPVRLSLRTFPEFTESGASLPIVTAPWSMSAVCTSALTMSSLNTVSEPSSAYAVPPVSARNRASSPDMVLANVVADPNAHPETPSLVETIASSHRAPPLAADQLGQAPARYGAEQEARLLARRQGQLRPDHLNPLIGLGDHIDSADRVADQLTGAGLAGIWSERSLESTDELASPLSRAAEDAQDLPLGFDTYGHQIDAELTREQEIVRDHPGRNCVAETVGGSAVDRLVNQTIAASKQRRACPRRDGQHG